MSESSAPNIYLYPCNRGMGYAPGVAGFHHFQAGPSGIVACVYCGKRGPDERQPMDRPDTP